MEILLLQAALLALWLFIRRDQASSQNFSVDPLPREQMRKGFIPGASVVWMGHAGAALLALIGSAQQFISPSLPPFTGRWSYVNATLYAALGKYGLAILWAVCVLAFAAVAFHKYKGSKRSQ